MFSSFFDVEFESEMKKARELSCVLKLYASSIRNARKLQEDGFKKLIKISESRNLDAEIGELEYEVFPILSYGC
jgi:hypothetical protein